MKKESAYQKELNKSTELLNSMKSARSTVELKHNWQLILIQLERAWNKVRATHKKHPQFKSWATQHESLRNTDPLLSYLTQARNADEHTIEETAEEVPGRLEISPRAGTSVVHLNGLVIVGGEIKHLETDGRITFTPARVELRPVTFRGRTYNVPNEHLGKAIDSKNIIELLRLGIEHYRKTFDDADIRFG